MLFLVQVAATQTQPFNEFGLPPPVEANEGLLQRNAMILERSGDFENALEIYQQLRMQNPDKDYYLQGVVRCLSALERYSEAASLLEMEINRQSQDIRNASKIAYLGIDLGKIYLDWGRTEEAWSIWEQVMVLNGTNPTVYRRISAALLQKRMVDEAITVLKRGDEIIKKDILTLDLARAYTNLMDYTSATEYYISYLSGNPKSYQLVERAVFSFPDDEKTVEEVSKVLLNSNFPVVKRLIRGYLFSLGKYRESMDYLLLHDASGQEILDFARQLQNENEYELACDAYNEVITKFNDSKFNINAQGGMAECLKQLGRMKESLMLYWEIINKYPFSSQMEKALYDVGEIYLNTFNDPDSAEYYFSKAERTFPFGKYKDKSSMMLGKCAVRKGDIGLAEERFNQCLKTASQNSPDIYPVIMFNLGKVILWKGNPDSAVYIWDQLVKKYSGSDIANDALSNILLLNKNEDNPLMNKYADSWFAFEKWDFDKAKRGFSEIINQAPGSLIAGRSLIFLSEIYFTSGEDSIKGFTILEDYVEEYPMASIRDEILFNLAERCWDLLGDEEKASHFYQKLIVEIPGSPLAPIARKKLEELGDNVIMETDLDKRIFIL